jgi:CBS domain-containing protein
MLSMLEEAHGQIQAPHLQKQFPRDRTAAVIMTSPTLEHGVPLGPSLVPQHDSTLQSGDEHAVKLKEWANKYRGATVADLDLPPALSTSPNTSLADAMLSASSHDYSHLTVLSEDTRSLLGYLPISHLKELFESRTLKPSDPVSKTMVGFQRKGGKKYQVITMETELWELEGFFENIGPFATGHPQDFAVVTDGGRKFVLGVVTRSDLQEFVRRRPA